jgi:hypothetical protein
VTEPDTLRVFVNERGVDVARGATALDALRALDADEVARVDAGERALVDSRGLPADKSAPAFAGAIYRTITAR